jgi:hypothetical protein
MADWFQLTGLAGGARFELLGRRPSSPHQGRRELLMGALVGEDPQG